MGESVNPCIIYQRLRPSASEASNNANEHIWPLTDELVEQEGYTPCGLYGDSEFAPSFCGGSEIRPGFEAALAHARRIAAKLGVCTLLIGDAAPIGDGDVFLPPQEPPRSNGGVHMRVVNFHLRPHTRSTSLRSAWRCFEAHRQAQHEAAIEQQIELEPDHSDVKLLVQRTPEHWLARLYLANPTATPLRVEWRQLVRFPMQGMAEERSTGWRGVAVAPRRAAYLETILQGELPWVRQVRIKGAISGRRSIGSVHFCPSDLLKDQLRFVWEDTA